MELLYNPEQMDDTELRETFVGRDGLIEELLALIEHQPEGPGVQHAVIIASRGMGKTTVLLMVRLLLAERGLTNQWLALKFPEESWGISDTSDLWCETLVRIAAATGETELERNAVSLRETAEPGGDIADAALALIRDWSRRSGKRLLLMIENLDQLFDQFSDEQELARLRDVLMNDGRIMLLGSATSYFHEAQGYEAPLYNFFKLYNLSDLALCDVTSLLRRRGAWEGKSDFDKTLAAESQRLRALRHFTGGNPRLILMLYRVITLTDIGDVHRALEKLLDEITPYYQSKTQSLPPQQRKILDQLARMGSERHEALTPQQIAEGTRLSPNQVSSQLHRLVALGYARQAELRGRHSFYTLSEPLYSVWYQMRSGNDARRRVRWFLEFLRAWYSQRELRTLLFASTPQSAISSGAPSAAWLTLDDDAIKYLRAALTPSITPLGPATTGLVGTAESTPSPPSAPVTASSWQSLAQRLPSLENSPRPLVAQQRRLAHVHLVKGINEREAGRVEASLGHFQAATDLDASYETVWFEMGLAFMALKRWADAVRAFGQVVELDPSEAHGWFNKGLAHQYLGENTDAAISYQRGLDISPNEPRAWADRGTALLALMQWEEANQCFDRSLSQLRDNNLLLTHKSVALAMLGRFRDAIECCDRAIRVEPSSAGAWNNKGLTLLHLKQASRSLECFDQALQLEPGLSLAHFNRGIALRELGKFEEAINSLTAGLEIDPSDGSAWDNLGFIYAQCDKYQEALQSYRRALELLPERAGLWIRRGAVLGHLKRWPEALESYQRAVELDPNDAFSWFHHGFALKQLGLYEKAASSLERGLQLRPDDADGWANSGAVFRQLEHWEKALLSFQRYCDLIPDDALAWANLGLALGKLGRWSEALTSYDQALSLQPNDPQRWASKGFALVNLGRWEEALHTYQHALSLDSKYTTAHLNSGAAYAKFGRREEALASYKRGAALLQQQDADLEVQAEVSGRILLLLAQSGPSAELDVTWQSLLSRASTLDSDRRQQILVDVLKALALQGQLQLARHLIAQPGIPGFLLPLARAVEYALTGDRALLEKLTPEIRSVAKEIAEKLPKPPAQRTGAPRAAKSKRGKRWAGPSRRNQLT